MHCVSVINNVLMAINEIIAVYHESDMKHVHTRILIEQNVQILKFYVLGLYIVNIFVYTVVYML
jgi:hypothetical protein